MKKCLAEIMCWLLALGIAFLIINILIIPFYYDPGWIKREGGANYGFYEPNKYFIQSAEGYGVSHVDENGYLNDGVIAESGYTLILGNSQSNMQFVLPEYAWRNILSNKLGGNATNLMAYNCSIGGYDFGDILEGFDAVLTEFPNSENLIIQITDTNIAADSLEKYKSQRDCNEEFQAKNYMNHLSIDKKIRNFIKDFFPIVIYIQENCVNKTEVDFTNAFGVGNIKSGLLAAKDSEVINSVQETNYKNELQKRTTECFAIC